MLDRDLSRVIVSWKIKLLKMVLKTRTFLLSDSVYVNFATLTPADARYFWLFVC